MPSLAPEERRRRRALLKAHHPDLGGDAESFIRAAAEFEADADHARPSSGDDVRFVRRARGVARVPGWFRQRQRRRARRGPPRVL